MTSHFIIHLCEKKHGNKNNSFVVWNVFILYAEISIVCQHTSCELCSEVQADTVVTCKLFLELHSYDVSSKFFHVWEDALHSSQI